MGLAADGRVFWAKNDLSSPKRICLLQKENMSSSHRKYVFFTQKICLLHTKNMSSSHRKYVFFTQKISSRWGGGGRCPVRFRAGTGMKIGNDGGRVGVVLG